MGVNGDHASKMWQSQHWLDLINFLRRRLVHGQDVHERTCMQSFRAHSISREICYPEFVDSQEYICVPILVSRFGNVANKASSVSTPLKITLTFPFISAHKCTNLIEV